MRVLCCTALVPIVMLGLFQQQQFKRAADAADAAQWAMAHNVAENARVHVLTVQNALRALLLAWDRSELALTRVVERTEQLQALAVFDAVGHTVAAHASPAQLRALQTSLEHNTQGAALGPQADLLVVQSEPESGLRAAALIGADFLTQSLSSMLQESAFEALLIDHDGHVLAASAAASTQAQMRQAARECADSGATDLLRTPGSADSALMLACARIAPWDWTVVVSQPVRVREQLQRDSLQTSGIFFLAAVLLTFLVGSVMGAAMTNSLNRLMQVVERFGRTARFEPVSKELEKTAVTEIVALARTFESMAQEVRQSQARLRQLNIELETQVAERTQTLMSRNSELRALQRLLVPMHTTEGGSQQLSARIAESVAQFERLLGLESLQFVPANAQDSADDKAGCVDVALSDRCYGRLQASPQAWVTGDRLESLRRLANSLAIVLANDALVEQLAKESKTMSTVFASMTDGIVIVGHSGSVLYANALACELLNDRAGIVGQDAQALLHARFEHQANSTRYVRRTASGALQIVQISDFTVSDLPQLPGKRHGWLMRDISKEAAMEAIEENLIGVVAHELKTPVTALRLLAERLQAQGQGPNADLEELLDETLRLGQLIDDFLDVSRIQAGAMQLKRRAVQVASLIDRAARLARSRCTLQVTRTIAPQSEVICVDADRIVQVLINLFVNAWRYRKPGATSAVCAVRVREHETDGVIIEVSDNGRGMSPEQLAHIFEPFYQADMSARRKECGLGLGLTIIQGIIEAHGGSVQVRSQINEGTCFALHVPQYHTGKE